MTLRHRAERRPASHSPQGVARRWSMFARFDDKIGEERRQLSIQKGTKSSSLRIRIADYRGRQKVMKVYNWTHEYYLIRSLCEEPHRF